MILIKVTWYIYDPLHSYQISNENYDDKLSASCNL